MLFSLTQILVQKRTSSAGTDVIRRQRKNDRPGPRVVADDGASLWCVAWLERPAKVRSDVASACPGNVRAWRPNKTGENKLYKPHPSVGLAERHSPGRTAGRDIAPVQGLNKAVPGLGPRQVCT